MDVGDDLSSTESALEEERISPTAHLQREINLSLPVSWNGQKSPGPADLQPLTELFFFLIPLLLPSPYPLSISISLLALYFLDLSLSSPSFVTFLDRITSFLILFSIPVFFLSPTLLSLPPSLMMCLAFKASHCCITGLFVSPSSKRRKKDVIPQGQSQISICLHNVEYNSSTWMWMRQKIHFHTCKNKTSMYAQKTYKFMST